MAMSEPLTELVNRLRASGWKVEEHSSRKRQFPKTVAARYPKLPPLFVEFLATVSRCEDASQTTWFLCAAEYSGESDAAFRWDEWERMSLEALAGDERGCANVRRFWDSHLPIVQSVGDGYAYFAIRTSADGFGCVVEGREPEFEEVSVVADSFVEFLERMPIPG
jgi:hypothetical protein